MKTILVVDDEMDLAEILRILLEDAGFGVLLAADAEECLVRLNQERPDLILLDVMLPRTSGYDLLRKLKAVPEWRTISVVMMSASPPRADPTLPAWEAFLLKPFDLDTLFGAIRTQLDRVRTVA